MCNVQVPCQRQVPPLFTRLFDDAAMFPPGNASAADALAGHLRYRDAWFADMVGPLLVPAHGCGRCSPLRTRQPGALPSRSF